MLQSKEDVLLVKLHLSEIYAIQIVLEVSPEWDC